MKEARKTKNYDGKNDELSTLIQCRWEYFDQFCWLQQKEM